MKSIYRKITDQCTWGKNSIKAELVTPKDRADRNISFLGTVSALNFGQLDASGYHSCATKMWYHKIDQENKIKKQSRNRYFTRSA